jgi:predicted DNA-binding transcriptional regulator AlpA
LKFTGEDMKKALLTTKEAAEYIGYGEQALKLARMEGKTIGGIAPPKHLKVGDKTVRYKVSDLDAWIDGLGK